MNKRLWGGRFQEAALPLLEEYGNSIQFDYQLAEQDLQGSIAHARMLGNCKIISTEESTLLIQGLEQLRASCALGSSPSPLAMKIST